MNPGRATRTTRIRPTLRASWGPKATTESGTTPPTTTAARSWRSGRSANKALAGNRALLRLVPDPGRLDRLGARELLHLPCQPAGVGVQDPGRLVRPVDQAG